MANTYIKKEIIETLRHFSKENHTHIQKYSSPSQPPPLETANILIIVHSKLLQSCPILGDSRDCSPPDSSIHGILQARILEWVTISFSRVRLLFVPLIFKIISHHVLVFLCSFTTWAYIPKLYNLVSFLPLYTKNNTCCVLYASLFFLPIHVSKIYPCWSM